MKMGKYICRNGRFVHESDLRPCFLATREFWVVILPACLTIWFFILMGLGVFG